MPDLLIELLSEEIPARMQRAAAGQLRKRVTDALVEAGLTYEGAKEYWTPRRLALDLRGLVPRSADIREERKGPRTDAPEKAIEGFMRGAGLSSIDQAEIRSDSKKGDFYVAVIETPGREAEAVIAEIMPTVIRDFNWPKSMRWGAASREPGSLRWVRPLHSILCTFGPETEDTEVVDFEIDGIRSGSGTVGHRFLAPEAIEVRRFDDYSASLEAAKVVLDAERRKEIIATDARNLAFARGLELVEDEGLLEETANLVEWPVVVLGEFGEEFLDIPDEVIRLAIRENQKCFVLRKRGEAELTNGFVLIANIEASDGGAEIARGNAKVVNARLSDAKFFWETDLRVVTGDQGFEPWLEGLTNVTFHARLGSQADRVARIEALAGTLAPVVGADPEKAKRAARLAKADLQSQMVYEFPELQGHMGRLYAEKAGEDEAVARAIEDHYKPLGPSDKAPTDPVSVAVALADKLDMLVGFWAIDEKPTGSKDPYALRRAALGVIRLVLENRVRLGLEPVIRHAMALAWPVDSKLLEKFQQWHQLFDIKGMPKDEWLQSYRRAFGDTADRSSKEFAENFLPSISDLLSFFHDRLKVHLRDTGARHDLIDAVLGVGTTSEPNGEARSAPAQESAQPTAVSETNDDLLIIVDKVRALQNLIESDDGVNLLAGYKRAANIIAAEQKKGTQIAETVAADLFETDAERALFETLEDVELLARNAIEVEDFEGAMSRMASLRAPIDRFFEEVLVNAEDDRVRANRLALLERIRAVTLQVADFSRISG